MRFLHTHATDVALPSAIILADEFFSHVQGKARERLLRRLTEFLVTALRAYAEFHPVAPEPSKN